MKSTFLQKITSLWVCVCFVGSLATPYTVYAELPLATVAPNTQFGRLLEAHKLLEIVPSQNMAQKILEESQTLLASSQLPEDQYQALYGKTKRLARALDLSAQFGECSGQQGSESQALSVFLQSDRPLSCSKISGPVSQSTSTIEELAKDTSHITEQITLDAFVDDLSDQTMQAMFTNYWMYKSTFDTPVPEDLDLAIKEVFGTLPVNKGKYLPLLGHVMNQTAHTNIAQKQQDMMAQLQVSVDRIKAIQVLPNYYSHIERYARHPTGDFAIYSKEFTPIFSQGAFEEYSPQKIAPTIEEGVGALWKMQSQPKELTQDTSVQEFNEPIQQMFTSLMGGIRPAGSTYIPSYFEEYTQWLKYAPHWQIEGERNPAFTFLSPQPFFPIIQEPRLPELFLARQKEAFKERLPVDIHVAEMAKSPLLFTKPLRDFVDDMDDDPSHLPTITQDHLNSALKDQQDTIRAQVQELNDLKSENPKEALKEFLKRDPLRVWKLAFEHPQMMDAICTATQGIKIDKESKEWWDKVYFWGGLGVGALALLTGVGALGLGAYGAGAGVMTAAGYTVVGTSALSLTTGGLYAGREILNAGEANQNYQALYASIVSDMGGDPASALSELDDFNSHVFNAVLAGSFSALDIAGLYGGVRSLSQLRQAKTLLQQPSKVVSIIEATKQRITLMADALQDPKLKVFMEKVLEAGDSIPDHIRPHAQAFLQDALAAAEKSHYTDLSQLEKLQKALKPYPGFQKELEEALAALPPQAPTIAGRPVRPVRMPRTNPEFRVPPEVQHSLFGPAEFRAAYKEHKVWIANATLDTTEMRSLNEGFSRFLNSTQTIDEAREIEAALRTLHDQNPKAWQALLRRTGKMDAREMEREMPSLISDLLKIQKPSGTVALATRTNDTMLQLKGEKISEGTNLEVFDHAQDPSKVVKVYKEGAFNTYDQRVAIRSKLEELGHGDVMSRVDDIFVDPNGNVVGYTEEKLMSAADYRAQFGKEPDVSKIQAAVQDARHHGIDIEFKEPNWRVRKNGQAILFDIDNMTDTISEHIYRTTKVQPLKMDAPLNPTSELQPGDIISFKSANGDLRFYGHVLSADDGRLGQISKNFQDFVRQNNRIPFEDINHEILAFTPEMAQSITRQPFIKVLKRAARPARAVDEVRPLVQATHPQLTNTLNAIFQVAPAEKSRLLAQQLQEAHALARSSNAFGDLLSSVNPIVTTLQAGGPRGNLARRNLELILNHWTHPETTAQSLIDEFMPIEVPTYVPGSASAWHQLGDTAGDMPMGPTSGTVMTESGGHYRFSTKMHPTEPKVNVLSVHYSELGEEAELMFPKARVGKPLPRIVTGSEHFQIRGIVEASQEHTAAAFRLERALDRYKEEFINIMNSIPGASNQFPNSTEGLQNAQRVFSQQFGGNQVPAPTRALATHILDELFSGAQSDGWLRSIPKTEEGIRRFEEGLQELEEFRALATQSH